MVGGFYRAGVCGIFVRGVFSREGFYRGFCSAWAGGFWLGWGWGFLGGGVRCSRCSGFVGGCRVWWFVVVVVWSRCGVTGFLVFLPGGLGCELFGYSDCYLLIMTGLLYIGFYWVFYNRGRVCTGSILVSTGVIMWWCRYGSLLVCHPGRYIS